MKNEKIKQIERQIDALKQDLIDAVIAEVQALANQYKTKITIHGENDFFLEEGGELGELYNKFCEIEDLVADYSLYFPKRTSLVPSTGS